MVICHGELGPESGEGGGDQGVYYFWEMYTIYVPGIYKRLAGICQGVAVGVGGVVVDTIHMQLCLPASSLM